MKASEVIGDWVVERTLGKGGMGTVFLCHHREDPSDRAALKIFPAWSTDEDGFRRFERECDVLRRLDHPGIVPLKTNRVAQGRDADASVYWLAMAYIDGPSLESRLDKGPLPPGFAASVFHRVSGALAHAHSKGVFHRDIKPANLVLGADGARLVDFGIALQSERTRLTAVGTFAGTLAYMPPEVVVDERIRPNPVLGDIYAMGVVLYEALTARRAFSTEPGLSERARQMRILKAKMTSEVLDPGEGIPEVLRQAVRLTTAPDPEQRLGKLIEFQHLMEQVEFEEDAVLSAPASAARRAAPAADSRPKRRAHRPSRLSRPGRRLPSPSYDTTPSKPLPIRHVAESEDVSFGDPVPSDTFSWRSDGKPEAAPPSVPSTSSSSTSPPTRAEPSPLTQFELPEDEPSDEVAPLPPSIAGLAGLDDEDTWSEIRQPPGMVDGSQTLDDATEETDVPIGGLPFDLDGEGDFDGLTAPSIGASAAAVPGDAPPPTYTPLTEATQPSRRSESPTQRELPPPASRPTPAPTPNVASQASRTSSNQPQQAAPKPGGTKAKKTPSADEEIEAWQRKRRLTTLLVLLVMLFAFVGTLTTLVVVRPFGLDQYQIAWDRVPGASSLPPAATTQGGADATPSNTPEVGATGPGTLDDELAVTDAWRDTGAAAAPLPWPKAEAVTKSPAVATTTTRAAEPKQEKRPVFFSSASSEDADVYIDGRRRGSTPVTLHLKPGTYRLKFAGGDGDATKVIDVKQFGVDEFVFEPGALKITNKFR